MQYRGDLKKDQQKIFERLFVIEYCTFCHIPILINILVLVGRSTNFALLRSRPLVHWNYESCNWRFFSSE